MKREFNVIIHEITFQPSYVVLSETFICMDAEVRALRKRAFGALGAVGLHNFTRWGNIRNKIKTDFGNVKIRTVKFMITDKHGNIYEENELTFDINGSILTIP